MARATRPPKPRSPGSVSIESAGWKSGGLAMGSRLTPFAGAEAVRLGPGRRVTSQTCDLSKQGTGLDVLAARYGKRRFRSFSGFSKPYQEMVARANVTEENRTKRTHGVAGSGQSYRSHAPATASGMKLWKR